MFLFKNKFRLCELFGIPIYLDFSLLFLLLFFLTGPGSVETGLLCAVLLLVSITVHELAHALTARAFGFATRDITLSLLGGCASLIALPRKAWQEFCTALAGPLASVGISLLAMALLSAASANAGFGGAALFVIEDSIRSFGIDLDIAGPFKVELAMLPLANVAFYLATMNMMLAIFNMLPGFPMDGGRVFRSLMRQFTSRVNATFAAMVVGRAVAVLIGLRGIVAMTRGGNWGFVSVLIAWMIWQEGYREYLQVCRESGWGRAWNDWRAKVSPPPYGGDGDEYDVTRNG